MLVTEISLYEKLRKLKDTSGICGVKAEYEAEGSSFRELVRLSRIAADLDIGVYLKIGGVEAKTDTKDAFELDVKGVIAPMVESKYGLKKFVNMIEQVYRGQQVHKTITIETKSAVDNIEDILDFAAGKIEQVTVGRSDLSASYFNDNIYPDSPFILDTVLKIGKACKQRNLKIAMGGSVSEKTIRIISKSVDFNRLIDYVETRKVILSTESWCLDGNVLNSALSFEKTYLESVSAFDNYLTSSNRKRIDELNRRIITSESTPKRHIQNL